ncbi:MAG: hypothetical protein M1833_002862 [Piccolia ochrophora]|nr:MAG: hypothetical protein M1833_002862 [Piccolia ochrophora]
MAGKRGMSSNEDTVSPPPLKRKLQSSTTNSAVANFFAPTSKKAPERITWRVVHGSLLTARYACNGEASTRSDKCNKVAGFDFDSTLIQTASGNRHGRDEADWRWWHPSVPNTLKKLSQEGYRIVILSNQAGISLKNDPKTSKGEMKRLKAFKGKVTSVLAQLDIQMAIYAATAHDIYRKPRTGMWDEMLEDYDMDIRDGIDLGQSFFVGDAGGRTATTDIGRDHSCSDRDFAANVGISFHTPEEYFLNEAPRPFSRAFNPNKYMGVAPDDSVFSQKNKLDMVMFCGSPGAGKSTFFWNHLKPLGYERVNQDILKTRERCIRAASEFLSVGKSVAIGVQ